MSAWALILGGKSAKPLFRQYKVQLPKTVQFFLGKVSAKVRGTFPTAKPKKNLNCLGEIAPTAEIKSSTDKARKIALVCDWLTTPGGAEKVLLELHHMYPNAPIYTSQYRPKKITWFQDAKVHTGWLQFFPASLRKLLGPLRALYFSHLDLSKYDIVISVTGAEAKAVKTQNNSHICYCHVPTQYYWQLYDQYLENPGFGILNPFVRLALKLMIKPLRSADFRAAQQPAQFVTISSYAASQIEQFYHRDSVIIAPPVDITRFAPDSKPSSKSRQDPPLFHQNQQEFHKISTKNSNLSTTYPQNNQNFPPKPARIPQNIHKKLKSFHNLSTEQSEFSTKTSKNSTKYPQKTQIFPQLIHKKHEVIHKFSTDEQDHTTETQLNSSVQLSETPFDQPYFVISCRQVTWKRVDLAIQACILTGKNLLVIGDGPEHRRLEELAVGQKNIRFIPWLESSELAQYLQSATAYIFPSLEPFGIAAVEALAAGCPVIAYASGGSRDIVQPGKNGIFFSEQTPESLAQALNSFQSTDYDRKAVSESAKKFSAQQFRTKISSLVDNYKQGTKKPHHD